MNLTRLRNSTWLPSIVQYYTEYKLKITWGDQDLINIYFHFHPGEKSHCTSRNFMKGLILAALLARFYNANMIQNDTSYFIYKSWALKGIETYQKSII